MSSMADEMAARLAADGGAGLPSGGDGGVAPGNEGVPPSPAPPAAGPSNTDTEPGSGTPENIPYARFKEVNDRYSQLRPFEELMSYGYDADSLRQLASFEAGYLQDPLGTLATMADNLDLPQELIDGIKAHAENRGSNGSAEGSPSGGEGEPSTALPKEMQERFEYIDRMRERENEAAREAQLQAVVQAWDRLDTEDGIETPEFIKLTAIQAAAASGTQFRSYDELAATARKGIVDYRSQVLEAAVRTGNRGGIPPALPGGTPPSQGPVKFKDLKDANRAIEAAISAGELPGITG